MDKIAEKKEHLDRLMRLAGFFATWDTVINHKCIKEKTGKDVYTLFEDYENGKIKAFDVIGTLLECIRDDTEEAAEKKDFFTKTMGTIMEVENAGKKARKRH